MTERAGSFRLSTPVKSSAEHLPTTGLSKSLTRLARCLVCRHHPGDRHWLVSVTGTTKRHYYSGTAWRGAAAPDAPLSRTSCPWLRPVERTTSIWCRWTVREAWISEEKRQRRRISIVLNPEKFGSRGTTRRNSQGCIRHDVVLITQRIGALQTLQLTSSVSGTGDHATESS